MKGRTLMPPRGKEWLGVTYVALFCIAAYAVYTTPIDPEELLSPQLKAIACLALLVLGVVHIGPKIGWEPKNQPYYKNMRSPGAIGMEIAISLILGFFCGVLAGVSLVGIFLLTILFPHQTVALMRTGGESVLQIAMKLFRVLIYGILCCIVVLCIGGVFFGF